MDCIDRILTKTPGKVYRGTASKTTPDDLDLGYTMWTDDPVDASFYRSPGGAIWELDISNAPYIGDLIDDITAQLLADYNDGLLTPDLSEAMSDGINDGYTARDVAMYIADDYNPSNIVNSAEAYDNWDYVTWLYERYAAPRGIDIIQTYDGAISFNNSKAVDTGAPEWY